MVASFRGHARFSPVFLVCPGDTKRDSRCHLLFALARMDVRTGQGSEHSVPIARAWRGPGGPSPAKRGERGAPKNLSGAKQLGDGWGRAFALADWLAQGGGKKSQHIDCGWGCGSLAPLPVSLRVRPVDRVVTQASPKL